MIFSFNNINISIARFRPNVNIIRQNNYNNCSRGKPSLFSYCFVTLTSGNLCHRDNRKTLVAMGIQLQHPLFFCTVFRIVRCPSRISLGRHGSPSSHTTSSSSGFTKKKLTYVRYCSLSHLAIVSCRNAHNLTME